MNEEEKSMPSSLFKSSVLGENVKHFALKVRKFFYIYMYVHIYLWELGDRRSDSVLTQLMVPQCSSQSSLRQALGDLWPRACSHAPPCVLSPGPC